MLGLPRSARLAAWSDSWLSGHTTLAEVIARVQGDDEPHSVTGMPGHAELASLAAGLELLQSIGVRALQVALPRPGDPVGLTGPAELTAEAVTAGEAVLCVGTPIAWVPTVRVFGPPGDQGHQVNWLWRAAQPPPPAAGLSEAERVFSVELIGAGATLTRLDVAAWRPEMAQLLDDIRSGRAAEPLPQPFPPAAQALAARAARVLAVVDVALADHGLALTATAAQTRLGALGSLERAARHALAAACNALAQ